MTNLCHEVEYICTVAIERLSFKNQFQSKPYQFNYNIIPSITLMATK